MSESKRPLFRIVYRDKTTKQRYECGCVWPGNFPDSHRISPQQQAQDGQYPRITLEDAAGRVARGEGYLDMNAPRGATQQPAAVPASFKDDDIAF